MTHERERLVEEYFGHAGIIDDSSLSSSVFNTALGSPSQFLTGSSSTSNNNGSDVVVEGRTQYPVNFNFYGSAPVNIEFFSGQIHVGTQAPPPPVPFQQNNYQQQWPRNQSGQVGQPEFFPNTPANRYVNWSAVSPSALFPSRPLNLPFPDVPDPQSPAIGAAAAAAAGVQQELQAPNRSPFQQVPSPPVVVSPPRPTFTLAESTATRGARRRGRRAAPGSSRIPRAH